MVANRCTNHEEILLVDKQGRWLSFSQVVLKTAGYAVSVTNSVADAWHLVSQNGAVFDLILVDLKRVEMESELFRQLAGPQGKRRPVVVLSPTTLTPSKMSYFFKLGAYDCLEKKYDEKGLVSLVKNLLAETTITKSDSGATGFAGRVAPEAKQKGRTETKNHIRVRQTWSRYGLRLARPTVGLTTA